MKMHNRKYLTRTYDKASDKNFVISSTLKRLLAKDQALRLVLFVERQIANNPTHNFK